MKFYGGPLDGLELQTKIIGLKECCITIEPPYEILPPDDQDVYSTSAHVAIYTRTFADPTNFTFTRMLS